MTAIRKHVGDFAAVIGLVLIAALVGGYILANQRLRFPWEDTPFKLRAEFSTAQAVTPGQGQTVRVSGVRIGDISKVSLREGRAVVEMDVDPEYADVIRTDASALLRPKTGLKDMFVELDPGTSSAPRAKDGFTIPLRATLPDVNPDEIYASLDADTRDYLKLLVQGAGQGLEKRGNDLQEVFARFEPLHRDLAKVNRYVARRSTNLRRLVHNLDVLSTQLAGKSGDLTELVSASAAVFRAFAVEDTNVSATVDELPEALRQTTQTLGKVEAYANELSSASEALRPVARSIPAANAALTPLAKEATPIVRDQVRPFVRASRPLVRDLRPAARRLAVATPKLTQSFTVLNRLLNMVGYNQDGREGPEDSSRDEGFLFWIAWLNHNAAAVFGTADAHGPMRGIAVSSPCAILKQNVEERPELEFLQGLTGALTDPAVCGAVLSTKAAGAKAATAKKGEGR